MKSSASVEHNFNFGLEKFKGLEKALKKKNVYTKVGILADKVTRLEPENDNVTLGLIHEFGSPTQKIPARSFLRMPIITKAKQITKMMSKNKELYEKEISKGNILKIFQDLGIYCEQIIQNAFETKGFGTWRDKKIVKDGKDMPLIDTGQLRRSITSEVHKGV